MKTNIKHMINGRLVGENKLVVPIKDLGLLRGFAVFDFLVTYNNKPFMIDDHIERLFNSATFINLFNPWTKDEIKSMVSKVLLANNKSFEKTIKIILTGGESSDGFTPKNKSKLIILISKKHKISSKIQEEGILLITNKHKRYLPQSKTCAYTEALKNISTIKEAGASEILYYDDSQVYECSRSNIFAVIDKKIITPKNNILLGITRKVVLKKLNSSKLVIERDFTIRELLKAKEIFITKSSEEIVPVVKIDDKIIGDGKVGETTKLVMREFSRFVKSEIWTK